MNRTAIERADCVFHTLNAHKMTIEVCFYNVPEQWGYDYWEASVPARTYSLRVTMRV